MFEDFRWARACSTRARMRLGTVVSSAVHAGRSLPSLGVRYGMDHLGVALVAALGHDVRAGTLPVHTGVRKGAAVIAVARRRSAHRDGQPGVGIDHDLPVHRVPVVLTGCRHGAVVGGHQAAIDDQHRVAAVPTTHRRQGQVRAEVIDHPTGSRFGHPEHRRDLPQRQVGPVLHRHQQHPISQRQPPAATGTGLSPPRPRTIPTNLTNCRSAKPVTTGTHCGRSELSTRSTP